MITTSLFNFEPTVRIQFNQKEYINRQVATNHATQYTGLPAFIIIFIIIAGSWSVYVNGFIQFISETEQ